MQIVHWKPQMQFPSKLNIIYL